jgi:hypothetical protein
VQKTAENMKCIHWLFCLQWFDLTGQALAREVGCLDVVTSWATVDLALLFGSEVSQSGWSAFQGSLSADEREGPAAGLSQGEGGFRDLSDKAARWVDALLGLQRLPLWGRTDPAKDQSVCDADQASQQRGPCRFICHVAGIVLFVCLEARLNCTSPCNRGQPPTGWKFTNTWEPRKHRELQLPDQGHGTVINQAR